MTSVTILVPTRNRAAPLARALRSLAVLSVPADLRVDVLVVDNSADGNAGPVVHSVAMPFPVRLVHEPRPGVSSARNRGVAEAAGDIVAFVDDDCEADHYWLAAQMATLARTGADASFGPRVAVIDGPTPDDASWFTATYSRDFGLSDGADVTRRDAHLPLPGAALVRSRCLSGMPFDPRLDHIGGEDVLLFRQLRLGGARFVWSPQARMIEHIPQSRIDQAFVMRRRYVSGQHRCLVPMLIEPPQRAKMLYHMAEGAVAATLAGPLALGGRAFGHWPPGPTNLLMSALGKLTWWRRNRPSLYGSGHR